MSVKIKQTKIKGKIKIPTRNQEALPIFPISQATILKESSPIR